MARVTVYGLFSGAGESMINCYDFNRKRAETLLADRVANEHASPGEHVVRCTVAYYNEIRAKQGLRPIVGPNEIPHNGAVEGGVNE